ncbi:MAG: SpoIIIAC/SpoIIIAD family protein [Christensenellales bacterium]|jgi:stage III sporulation protein AD
MEIWQIIGLALVFAAVIAAVRTFKAELVMPLSIAAGAVLLIIIFVRLAPVVKSVEAMAVSYGVDPEAMGIVIKVVVIAYITEFAVHTLKDAGETALSSKVELGGKIIIAALALPVVGKILETVSSLLAVAT